jgi:hypothetical protein
MALETYTKINTLYKRYVFDTKTCPKKEWLKFKNKIILGDFSYPEAAYLFNNDWEITSKIDGTNSKIAFFPSTMEIRVEGKTEKAQSQHGQFEFLQEIADRIRPILCDMFPKESARFAPVKNKETNKVQYYIASAEDTLDIKYFKEEEAISALHMAKDPKFSSVEMEEVPIYIYGEYFGSGIQKCGSRYIQNGNDFLVFDIKQQGWWTPKDVRDALCKGLNLNTVPFLGVMTLKEIEDKVRAGFATQFDRAADPTMLEEGIVARPTIPLCDGSGNRIIVKVKYCDYIEYDAVRKEFSDAEFEEFDKWYHENYEDIKIG